jgi:hypothetical protein
MGAFLFLVRSPMMPDRRTTAPDFTTQRQIETHLHTKLEVARTEYDSASERHKRALECVQDGNGNDDSVSQAVEDQHHAFEEYQRAVDNFNRFILYGDLPGGQIQADPLPAALPSRGRAAGGH